MDIVPTITAYDPHQYREQEEAIASFASRIHIDIMDGVFAPTVSVRPEELWWEKDQLADIHVMFQEPVAVLDILLRMQPHLIVVQAETVSPAEVAAVSEKVRALGVKLGVSLLADTHPEVAGPYLHMLDHVLVFSGKLGYHGGSADLSLLQKVSGLKKRMPAVEIGWDGGIDDKNILQLRDAGVTVFNTGGFIQKAENPKLQYEKLVSLLQS